MIDVMTPDLQEKFNEALDEICTAYDGGQKCDANEVFARFGLRVVAGDEAVAATLLAQYGNAALVARQKRDSELASRYVCDVGMVELDPPIMGAAVRAVEKQIQEEARKRWDAGENGPWVWSHGSLRVRQEAAE